MPASSSLPSSCQRHAPGEACWRQCSRHWFSCERVAELVSAEEGIEKGRGPHVDGLYVGVWGSWAYLKQAPSESLSMAAFFCGWRSYPPP